MPDHVAITAAPQRAAAAAASHPIPDRHGQNLFSTDAELHGLLALYLPADLFQHLLPHLDRMGALAGGVLDDLANQADHNPPALTYRTRTGIDTQRIEKHPAYVELERVAFSEFGLAAASHRGDVLGWPGKMPAAAKYALTYLFVQAEFGLCCPLSMTDSLTRTLRKFGDPALVERFLPGLTTLVFEDLVQGAMFMTEQGAGSDVAATLARLDATTRPKAAGCLPATNGSAPTPTPGWRWCWRVADDAPAGIKGVSLFLLPRTLPDGSLNHYRIIRLKDKLGTRSMASGEIRLEGAVAWLVGEPGRGFVQMADMINNSRLSNGVRAAGLMRRALSEGLFIAHERRAFGKRTAAHMPLMRRQLLKLTPAHRAGPHHGVPDRRGAAPRRCRRGECLSADARADPADQVPRLSRRAQGDWRRHGNAWRLRLYRGMERPATGARCPPGVDLGGHQQYRRARRAARHPP
jgi:acyl-CoA dehydrogenase